MTAEFRGLGRITPIGAGDEQLPSSVGSAAYLQRNQHKSFWKWSGNGSLSGSPPPPPQQSEKVTNTNLHFPLLPLLLDD